MKNDPPDAPPLFDEFAADYDAQLEQGISVSGESKDFFAQGRAAWLARRLIQLGSKPQRIMDFGCGTGSATPFLLGLSESASVLGVDVSPQSVALAARQHGSSRATFSTLGDYAPAAAQDMAFCNGVFHHIPPAERAAAVRFIHGSLRPSGLFAFWENNPWNPGTRLVMSRIAFDRDAITLTPPEARRLLADNGFEILGLDFQFIFPNFLRWLRPLETPLCRLPFGAQYMVLGRKPA